RGRRLLLQRQLSLGRPRRRRRFRNAGADVDEELPGLRAHRVLLEADDDALDDVRSLEKLCVRLPEAAALGVERLGGHVTGRAAPSLARVQLLQPALERGASKVLQVRV